MNLSDKEIILMLKLFFQSIRPTQWTKNALLFAGLIFSKQLDNPLLALRSLAGFVVFCALSGCVYILNDILDQGNDKLHPLKSQRPIASGALPIPAAITGAVLLCIGGLFSAFYIDIGFGWISVAYLTMMIGYNLVFKKIVILDVLIIALGFVLRAAAGAEMVDVSISSWLLTCTIFLALFLALSKRRHEIQILGEKAPQHRANLMEYSPNFIDQMIAVVTASTVMAYALYTTSPETVEKFETRNLIYTLPFVLYGIFRYLFIVHIQQEGGSPEKVFLRDKPMILNVILYFVTVIIILYR
ncbi:decaprenyl-phosphate phosphoribosyltransferase [candidate division KSB1 bacterium]|nr:decaprenyl-phosphate phosphoribosyltransferase [candidate division KSB1 bacterium]